jgi:hypothetical protein
VTREDWDARFRARVVERVVGDAGEGDWTQNGARDFASHVLSSADEPLYEKFPEEPELAADEELENWEDY